MKLIVDSGSTKTDWELIERKETVKSFTTRGLNPFFKTTEGIKEAIKTELLPQIEDEEVREIHFYGAGCTPEKIEPMHEILSECFPEAQMINVESDALGAARGLCGRQPGIACVLGTGSNSCFYDGEKIVANVSPLGYVLGDEGSGAVLGRVLVGDLLKNQLPKGLKEEFLKKYALTPAEILERVYRQPFPNRFLASLSPFLLEHIALPEMQQIVQECFIAFLNRNVKQYDYQKYPVYFTGSISYYYHQELFGAASRCGVKISSIVKSPMGGLVAYHS